MTVINLNGPRFRGCCIIFCAFQEKIYRRLVSWRRKHNPGNSILLSSVLKKHTYFKKQNKYMYPEGEASVETEGLPGRGFLSKI